MAEDALLYQKAGKTALITLNRPRHKNALDAALGRELLAALQAARDDAEVRSLVLTGAGGDFCSGADLKDDQAPGEKAFAGRNVVLGFHRWFSELMDFEKPVIAAVDGFAAGAGMSVALAADFVIATPRARLVASFARIGLIPDLSLLYLLPRLVGLARAKEIVFSARQIDADEALAMGLVQAVVPAERLRETALEYAARFDQAPTQALGLAKSILNRAFETDRHALTQLEAAVQSMCGASDYHAEAVRRFRSREAPLFTGAARA
ncbi:enoyl-CoA hydratase/isomerase family protein [Ramlibacter solisilvae]|uniref:Enoyl-CoA hydratase n=1 Tax=Ramlibacter tataouinensis TaxID=94132 RepID=A0A127JW98_9BURK|nr:enoyl-CoA hydratase/isomerase family protein [Ramlibacter tataouinensis]AMO24153.1 enoyl-CoA hydratase [Ramlibacter tataouinensis]